MCIICLKPAGVDMPSDKEIKHMFDKNPHGAGFALQGDIHNDGRFLVEYHKGFMNVDDLIEALGPKEKLKDLTVAIHCRIKTSGETDKFTTHPFPISNQYADLRKTDGSGPVLFHNGVFSGLGGLVDKNSSDTQDFVVGIASRYLKKAKMPSKLAQAIIGEVIGSCRVLVMYPHRNFPYIRWGTWHEHNGCYYSNTGYLDESKKDYYDDYFSGYKYSYSKSTHDLDEWGCNTAEYAWPSPNEDWIRFTDSRWETLMRQVKDPQIKDGKKICKFYITNDTEWIVDDERHEIYTAEREDDVKLRNMEEDYYDDIWCEYAESDYICFGDEESLLDFCSQAQEIGAYIYRYKGKDWYIDTVSLEAYTDKGIKKFFATGEQGHAKKQMAENGTYLSHSIPFGGVADNDDYLDEEEEKEMAEVAKGL